MAIVTPAPLSCALLGYGVEGCQILLRLGCVTAGIEEPRSCAGQVGAARIAGRGGQCHRGRAGPGHPPWGRGREPRCWGWLWGQQGSKHRPWCWTAGQARGRGRCCQPPREKRTRWAQPGPLGVPTGAAGWCHWDRSEKAGRGFWVKPQDHQRPSAQHLIGFRLDIKAMLNVKPSKPSPLYTPNWASDFSD